MNKLQILVVEDDAPVRNLITTTLKVHDYRHITAASGEAAIREASSRNPDVVLLDLGLPDMDGVEVIRRIRSWSHMPLLCLLAKNVGKVLTHTFITQKIWGSSWDNDIASLRVFMATLRKKLEAAPDSPQYIQTHIGVGYRMLRVE